MVPKGRAATPRQKRAAIDRLYAAWLEAPNLRLGQLIYNAGRGHDFDFFNVEDQDLILLVEQWVRR